jgi:hypothetical protein
MPRALEFFNLGARIHPGIMWRRRRQDVPHRNKTRSHGAGEDFLLWGNLRCRNTPLPNPPPGAHLFSSAPVLLPQLLRHRRREAAAGLIPARQPVILADGTRNDRNSSNKSPRGANSEALTSLKQTISGSAKTSDSKIVPGRSIGITEGT